MASGVIARIVKEKGFGFIRSDGKSNGDLFFHRTAILNSDFESLEVGHAVTFTLGQSSKGPRAENIHVTSD